MPNTIVLAKTYVPLLDEVYQREPVTSDLTGDTWNLSFMELTKIWRISLI